MHPASILAVDDTPGNLRLLVDLLTSEGYAVLTAASGPEAVRRVKADRPDLVLLDVVMPGMDGFEVCRLIRTDPQTTLLPVIMVTALYPGEERVKGLEAGADDFLTQPVNRHELLARVRSLLRIKLLQDAVQAHAGEVEDWNKKLQARLDQETKLAEVARSLGDIVHEIKNLLMPIVTGAGLLRTELTELFDQLPPDEARRARASERLCTDIIDMLSKGAERIHVEVKEIADCVKGLSTPLHLGPCQVQEVVNSVLKTLQLTASQRRIALRTEELDSLPSIHADQRRLFNVFYNLVNNAIPEVPSGGSITIRGQTEPDRTALLLSVTDTGRGMPAEFCRQLLTGHAVSTKTSGTGLGIKIVKHVVEAHGGVLTVESKEGTGTTFFLRLPIDPLHANPLDPGRAGQAPGVTSLRAATGPAVENAP